jgi:type I restriction enzyme, S subunit
MPTASAVVPVGYKQTEVGVIPEGWIIKSLIETCNYVDYRGRTPPKSDRGRVLVTSRNIRRGRIDYERSKEYISESTYAEYMKRGIPIVGDVLITTEAPLGMVAQIDDDTIALAQRVIKYRPKDIDLYSKFLMYFLLSHSFQNQLKINTIGSTASGIKGSILHRLLINYPSNINEQRVISEALNDIDYQIESLKNIISKKRDIKQGAMQELLTGKARLPGFSDEWKTIQLGNILTVMSGKDWKHVANETGKYPVLGTGGIMGWADDYLYDQPCVLIGRKGTIDKPQYMEKPFWSVDTLFYCILSKNNFAKFVYYKFLQINWYSFNEASGVPSLNSGTIGKITIKMPRLGEQEAIANVLSDMDAEIAALEKRLEKAKAIKQGIMQQLLTGKIRLVEPQTSQEVSA